MKKIWLTLLSLVVAVVFQVTNVQADGNQVSFTKDQDNVAVKVTLPEASQVHALKLTIKVASQSKTAPEFVFEKPLEMVSQVHQTRYDADKQELTLYLADLDTLDFSTGITLGEFTGVTTKTTFSAVTGIEIVDATEKSVAMSVQADSLVVNDQTTQLDPTPGKGEGSSTENPSTPIDSSKGNDDNFDLKDNQDNVKNKKPANGVLGQTGEQKSMLLTVMGTLVVFTTGLYYLKIKR